MTKFSMQDDMRRAFSRCPACARQQLQIENGQYVPGDEVKGQLHSTPRGGGSTRRARAAASPPSRVGGSRGTNSSTNTPTTTRDNLNLLAQHEIRPDEIICNHCLCSNVIHEDTGPNGQRCCGGLREGTWDKVCEVCRLSEDCKAWSKAKECPAAAGGATAATTAAVVVPEANGVDTAEGIVAPSNGSSVSNGSSGKGSSSSSSSSASATEKPCKTEGRGQFCTHCTCPCAETNPHKFEDSSTTWVSKYVTLMCLV